MCEEKKFMITSAVFIRYETDKNFDEFWHWLIWPSLIHVCTYVYLVDIVKFVQVKPPIPHPPPPPPTKLDPVLLRSFRNIYRVLNESRIRLTGGQWLSSRVLDSRPRGRGFESHRRHCVVSLSKNINPSLIPVQPRKTRPFITERLLIGRKEPNQTNKTGARGRGNSSTFHLLKNRCKKTESAAFQYWRFSLFLQDPFFLHIDIGGKI